MVVAGLHPMSANDPPVSAVHRRANQFFTLGGEVGEAFAPQVQGLVLAMDPQASIEVDVQRRLLSIGSRISAEALADLLLHAGVCIRSWAAELPAEDGHLVRPTPHALA